MEDLILKTGTGELEIVVFNVLGQKFAINVLKTKEIVAIDNITKMPLSDNSIKGLTTVRDKIYPVIDLSYVLYQKDILENKTLKEVKGLLCEFNKQEIIFLIDDVHDILRIKWEDVESSQNLLSSPLVVGTILYENDIYSMLDFEKILGDRTESLYKEKDAIAFKEKRKDMKIYLAEDSKLINGLIKDTLGNAGYTNVRDFENGQLLLDYLNSIANKNNDPYSNFVDLIITDIEMPQLDGLTLTKRLKDNPYYKDLKIVVFSSLITEDLKHKAESVGADEQVSKPDIDELVSKIDKLLHI